MDHLPIFVKLRHRRCLVVGGGETALRKIRLLLRAAARVVVCAERLNTELRAAWSEGKIEWLARQFEPSVLYGMRLVIAATGDPSANRRIVTAADRAGIWANAVDDGIHSAFVMPAIVDRSPLVVAISTGGAAPVLARQWRSRIEALMPARLGDLANLAGWLRQAVAQRLPKFESRRAFWERLFRGSVAALVFAGRRREAGKRAWQLLTETDSENRPGRVTLVGAGPGDPGLLTLRGLQALQDADVIVYDRLVSDEVLDLARRDARRLDVGKAPGGRRRAQADINRILVDEARQGRHVVRLKGGDPFIFGRGGEEVEALAAARIPFEVVPGITAAAGCAAYSAIPLTHRLHAQAVTFATAHCRRSIDRVDWRALAGSRHTVVFYMGVGMMDRIAGKLIEHGRSPGTPVAVVERGTTPHQRVVCGTLGHLAELADRYQVRPPAVVMVGETVASAENLGWFGERPEMFSAWPAATAETAHPAQPDCAASC